MDNEFKTNLNNVLKVLPYQFNHSEFGGVEYTCVIANYETGEVITGDIARKYDAEEFDWIRVCNTDIEDDEQYAISPRYNRHIEQKKEN